MDTDRRTQAPRPRQRAMPTTRTALVRLAQQGDAPDRARAALGELCLMYWQPVHVFIRRSWVPRKPPISRRASWQTC